jgi:tetratricopeptide (TPR) repeat protein
MKSRAFVVLFLLAGSVAAQIDAGNIRRVRIRLVFSNGACDVSAHVTLVGNAGPIAENTATEQCETEFFNVPAGTYRVHVSGQNLANTDAGSITVSATGSAEFEVNIKPSSSAQRSDGPPAGALVSAADLNVPASARKEFDKANQLIVRQDFKKAIERLDKAIAIYPAYAGAYNNLAVAYAHLGDKAREREELQKAISVNDHFAAGFVNLGRMDMAAGDFASAEAEFSKGSACDATDVTTLVLLTYAEFMDQHFDEAIATSNRAHMLTRPHAFAHQVAARAFEQKRDAASAIAELEQFLKEESNGPRAEVARRELAMLQAAATGPLTAGGSSQ